VQMVRRCPVCQRTVDFSELGKGYEGKAKECNTRFLKTRRSSRSSKGKESGRGH